MDPNRRQTLQTLLDLATGPGGDVCWHDDRASHLLRTQSTPQELLDAGASPDTVRQIFEAAPSHHHGPGVATGVFTVRVEARFEAAHFLREYRGISEPLHGHSYKVEAELAARGGGVDADAIAVDFVSARRKLESLAKRLDYTCINEVPPFDSVNPTAENVASWFARELGAEVADENAVVKSVTVWEGPVNSVTFSPGQ